MSAVNVLAVLDLVASDYNLPVVGKASEAVAELIAAASDPDVVRNYQAGVVGPTNARVVAARARLKAAVAAVGGAA